MYMYLFVWISVYVFVDVSSYVDCVLEEVCHVLVFLHLRTTNVLGPDSNMRSEHAQQRRLSADIPTTSVCGDDALECESCSSRSCECTLFSFFAIPMGVIRDQLFCITLTLGRFASSLSCDFAHHGPHCPHVCAYTHHSLLLHLSLVFVFVTFSSQMEEHQNVRLLNGTTEWNHSYYTSNSLSALHSLQQLQDGTSSTSAQPLASTKETKQHCALRLHVQPTVSTQYHQLTSSCGPHSQCHRRSNAAP